jgi:tagatose 6-phosphate kinase
MILCAALSPAWDVTFHVPRFEEHATNRASSTSARAGGKAVNVARVLHTLGEDVRLVLPVGGRTGDDVSADLARAGIPHDLVASTTETRRTVTVVNDETGDATLVNEGSRLLDWPGFLERVCSRMAGATVVVASGSLPDGAPGDAFAQLAAEARANRVPVVLDTSGPALLAALQAGATLVKPNLAELREVTGDEDPRAGAARLAQESGSAVAVSAGPDGIFLAVGDDVWHASLPRPLHGNPTGAGDAAVASFARGIARSMPWPEMLRHAVALSGAAVLAPYAGDAAPVDHAELLRLVKVAPVAAHV